jgi:hypothetical protein
MNAVDRVKEAYLTEKNAKYILQKAYSQLGNVDKQFLTQHHTEYIQTLFDLQQYIYNEYFLKVAGHVSDGNISSSLDAINNLTINKLLVLINQHAERISKQTEQKMAMTTSSETKQITNNALVDANTALQHLHAFSQHANFQGGRYTFDVSPEQSFSSIFMQKVVISSKNYNVNEFNNRFKLTERIGGEHTTEIALPVGCYSLPLLLKQIGTSLTSLSPSKSKYIVEHNSVKNKVSFLCVKDGRAVPFSLHFDAENECSGLNAMLGFRKFHYHGNSAYVGEQQPMIDLYKNIYVRLFIDEKEVPRILTTNKSMCYFYEYSNSNNTATHDTSEYMLNEPIHAKSLAVEFLDVNLRPIIKVLDFNILFTIG